MRILVLYKISTYKTYFLTDPKRLKPLEGLFNSNDIKRFRRTHETHYWTLEYIQAVLKSRKLTFKCSSRGKKIDYSRFDFIITIGGDGTFLEASRHIKDQMILGVNSDPNWSVGRFCVSHTRNFESLLDNIIANKAKIKYFQRMSLTLSDKQRSWTVLNDCLFCHTNPGAMSRYHISLGSKKEEQRSSGVWVATAAGSTGAIHSAGAPALDPASKNLQFMPRELYKGLKTAYKLKGGVIKPGQVLQITSLMRDGVVYVDGCHVSSPFRFGYVAQLQLSPYPLRTFDA